MSARRFLGCIFLLTLVVVAGAFAETTGGFFWPRTGTAVAKLAARKKLRRFTFIAGQLSRSLSAKL